MMASYTSLHARHLSEHSKQAFLGYDNDCFLFGPYVLLMHLQHIKYCFTRYTAVYTRRLLSPNTLADISFKSFREP